MSTNYCPKCATASKNRAACPVCGFAFSEDTGSLKGDFALLRTASGQPVPLLGVSIGGEVFGAHARLVLRQRYKNRESDPIEAVYTFPIPSDATLTGFAMECDGRRLEAEVKEREEAFAKYDDAIAKGHGAALLEQERPNVFTASVGNLLPDEETVVEVSFLLRLTADEGALRLAIPTLVAPRYIPGKPSGDRTGHGSSAPTDAVPDADRITPKIGAVSYGLSMDVVFDLGREVTVESPSHAIRVESEAGSRRRVTFVTREVALDRDLILVAEGAPGVAAGVVCDRSQGEEGTFALTLVPDLFEAKKSSKGRAVVFVVDVSGSMAGASLDQAKRAMRLCLRHLSEGDLFDIVPFSTTFGHMSGGARGAAQDLIPFTQVTLREADSFVDRLVANGGTEMLAPLLSATRLLEGLRRDRIVVLLTDGQVGNEAQIVEEVSTKAAGARVYTFGIGTNVSDVLLRGLAKRTKGAVEFIHPGERIDEKVTAQFARATAARVDGVTLRWVGADAGEVAPSDPPALVDGEPWSVYGRYETPGIGRVEIRGTLGGEPFYMEVPLELSASASRPTLTSLWAGARVKDLEDMSAASEGRRAEANKRRIIDLCVRHGIASKYASFVVVEKRTGERRSQGMPETRAVPVNAPAGWAMFQAPPITTRSAPMGGGMRRSAPAMARSMAAPMPARAPMPAAPPPPPGYAPPPPPMASGGFGAPPPPPAFGGPPRMADGFAPPPPPAAPSAMPAGAPRAAAPMGPPEGIARGGGGAAKGEGGFFDRAKKALGLSRKESAPMQDFSDDAFAERDEEEAAPPRRQQAGDIGAVFATQLANGLWEGPRGADEARLASTAEVLARCAREGVDSGHSIYGAQIVKAVEGLTALLEGMAQRGEGESAAIVKALLAMAAVSTGKRARARIAEIARASKDPAVNAIVADLASQEAARKRLG